MFLYLYCFVGIGGLEPSCDQLRFRQCIRLSRYIPILIAFRKFSSNLLNFPSSEESFINLSNALFKIAIIYSAWDFQGFSITYPRLFRINEGFCAPAWAWTRDLLIMSQLLLTYWATGAYETIEQSSLFEGFLLRLHNNLRIATTRTVPYLLLLIRYANE